MVINTYLINDLKSDSMRTVKTAYTGKMIIPTSLNLSRVSGSRNRLCIFYFL